ncbi:MAG: cytochrome D1 domain-containing protein [Methyloprofundus sp.]|nr:cytochrome D1 domain-containing protein [Methyloprofundus sp.]MDT8426060.1 cytochrome D1 domain-containing protein [Methyloprofundus sp.]
MELKMTTLKKSILAASIGLLFSSSTFAEADNGHKMHQLYQDNCASCHGSDHGGYLAPALNSETLKGRSPTALRSLIMTGSFETLMPPFFGRLSDNDIRAMVKHLQSTPKLANPAFTIADMKASLKVYVKDESKLPNKPTFKIDSMDDIIGVAARGKYGRGEGSEAVFINSKTHQQIGVIPTVTAAHIIEFSPANERWAYVKTDTAEIYKVDLYTMQAVRSIKTGWNGPGIGISRDGKYLMAGSFVPHNAVILNADTLEPLKQFELEGIDPDGNMVSSDSGMVIGTPFADIFAIALENAGQVWVVDLKDDFPVTKIKDVGRHLHDAFLTHKGKKLMIASYDDSIVTAIDLEKREIIKKLPAGCVPHVGGGAAVKVDGRTLGFGTNFGSCDKTVVSVWDLDTMELVKQVPVSGGTESPAAHANAPYVAVDIITKDRRARTIQLIDKKTLEVVKTLDVGGHAYFPEYSADGKSLYVSAGYAGDEVVVYDSTSLKKTGSIQMESPAGIFSRGRVKYMTRGLSPDEME